MLVVRLLLNSRLLVVKFGGSQEIRTGFQQHAGRCPNPHVQESAVVILYL